MSRVSWPPLVSTLEIWGSPRGDYLSGIDKFIASRNKILSVAGGRLQALKPNNSLEDRDSNIGTWITTFYAMTEDKVLLDIEGNPEKSNIGLQKRVYMDRNYSGERFGHFCDYNLLPGIPYGLVAPGLFRHLPSIHIHLIHNLTLDLTEPDDRKIVDETVKEKIARRQYGFALSISRMNGFLHTYNRYINEEFVRECKYGQYGQSTATTQNFCDVIVRSGGFSKESLPYIKTIIKSLQQKKGFENYAAVRSIAKAAHLEEMLKK